MVEPARTGGSAGRGALLVRLVILAIVAAAVWYGMARIEWPAMWRAVVASSPAWILAGVASALLSHLLRAHRWRLLIPEGRSIPLMRAFSATMIGYMFNNIIPRSGELARPWVLARSQQRPLSAMIASVVVERILDGLSLALVVVAILFAARTLIEQLLPEYSAGGLVAAIVVPVLALVVILVLAVRTALGDRLAELVGRRLSPRLGERLGGILRDFRSGVGLGGPGNGVQIVLLSILIWAGYWFGLYAGLHAFGLDESHDLGVRAALVTLGITSIGITIAPTPGGLGVYHTFCVAALTILFGVGDELATAYALVTHGAPYVAVTAVGAAFSLSENISIGSVLRRRGNLPPAAPSASAQGPGTPEG